MESDNLKPTCCATKVALAAQNRGRIIVEFIKRVRLFTFIASLSFLEKKNLLSLLAAIIFVIRYPCAFETSLI